MYIRYGAGLRLYAVSVGGKVYDDGARWHHIGGRSTNCFFFCIDSGQRSLWDASEIGGVRSS